MTLPKPFQDDSASGAVGSLTIENGPDRIAIYGQLDITRDQMGLALARELARFLDMAIATLAADRSLPDHVAAPPPTTTVRNPFA